MVKYTLSTENSIVEFESLGALIGYMTDQLIADDRDNGIIIFEVQKRT